MNQTNNELINLLNSSNSSYFITGKAGTGKSTLLESFKKQSPKKIVVLAPTGIAALNVGGQTIHSFFKIRPNTPITDLFKRRIDPNLKSLLIETDTIIIDEISMVRCDLIDTIDLILRRYLKSKLPFANKQLIFFGDLFQLPPILKPEETKQLFEDGYETPYFYSAKAFQDFNFQTIELQKVFRQTDEIFVRILNKIRRNEIDQEDLDLLNARHLSPISSDKIPITLTLTNASADQINQYYLSQISSSYKVCRGKINGDFNPNNLPTDLELKFKIGAQVILLNNDPAGEWVNGSIGTIIGIEPATSEQEAKILVQLPNKIVKVGTYKWELTKYILNENQELQQDSLGSFKQYPFKLAWAITIHKSQGQTFEKAIIDLGNKTFAHGQAYVALSRCTSLEGISLKQKLTPQHIILDPNIVEYMESINN